jgi:hypothetical protein
MESKRKQIHLRQKAHFEQKLADRMAFLAGKGITSRQADRDPIVRKWKAEIKAAGKRLKRMAEIETLNEELAKHKAEKAAAPKVEAAPAKAKEGGKAEKPKKAAEEGKEKKAKPDKKAAPKAPEGGQG